MSNNPQADYAAFQELKASYGYQLLQNEWLHQISEIEESRDKAAKRGTESAWRYWAGQEKGAKLMATVVERAIQRLEKELEEENKSINIDELLEGARSK